MKSFLTSHVMVSVHLLILALVFTAAALFVNRTQADLLDAVDTYVAEKHERVQLLSEMMSENGADDIVSATITDCTERTDFDDLLGRLDSTTKAELIRVQQLLEACGKYYPTRSALMAVRLKEAHNEFESALEFRNKISERQYEPVDIDGWRKLVSLEERRSAYLNEQYELQDAIIRELILNGRTKDLQDLAARAQDLNELLEVANIELKTARSSLLP